MLLGLYPSTSSLAVLASNPGVEVSTALGAAGHISGDIKAEVSSFVHAQIASLSTTDALSASQTYNPWVKGTALAYANLYQLYEDQQDGVEDALDSSEVTEEDLAIAENLLRHVCENSTYGRWKRPIILQPSVSMEKLQEAFIRLVNQLGTPLLLGFETRYTRTGFGAAADTSPRLQRELTARSVTPGRPVQQLHGGHAAIVAGVTEENGTVYVMYRDPHHEDGTYDTQTLEEFLTPRFIPAIRTSLGREPSQKDWLRATNMRGNDTMRGLLTNQ